MVRRRDDWDDSEAMTSEKGPGLLSTPRILAALAVVVVVALVIGGVVKKEDLQFNEVPPRLMGLWTCSDRGEIGLFCRFQTELHHLRHRRNRQDQV